MARVSLRAGEVRGIIEADSINVEKYVMEIATLLSDLTKAIGKMFEEEHLRMINMVTSMHTGGLGGAGGPRLTGGIIEHKAIQNLRAVNRDQGLFR